MSHISDKIICPKCNTQNLRKSIVGPHNSKYSNQTGKEYFCDRDHEYFGIDELVNIWNYDVADFYSGDFTQLEILQLERVLDLMLMKPFTPEENLQFWCADTVSDMFEGNWNSKLERDLDYEEVTAMQLGIPSWAMENNEVDTGATHV